MPAPFLWIHGWLSVMRQSLHWMFRYGHRSSICWKTCRQEFHLTYLFIAHDLSVVEYICDVWP